MKYIELAVIEVTDRHLVKSLASDRCPFCGLAKRPRDTFCRTCYRKLSQLARSGLYTPVGEGYRERVIFAAGELAGRRLKSAQPIRPVLIVPELEARPA